VALGYTWYAVPSCFRFLRRIKTTIGANAGKLKGTDRRTRLDWAESDMVG